MRRGQSAVESRSKSWTLALLSVDKSGAHEEDAMWKGKLALAPGPPPRPLRCGKTQSGHCYKRREHMEWEQSGSERSRNIAEDGAGIVGVFRREEGSGGRRYIVSYVWISHQKEKHFFVRKGVWIY